MPRKTATKKTSAFPLLDHVDDLMSTLRELLPTAIGTFDADSIHQSRVSTRRLKAALDLLEPVLSKRHRKPLADELKRLRRRLGPLRDADVMVDALVKLEKATKVGAAAKWLRGRTEKDRDELREETTDGPSAKKEVRRLDGWALVRAEIVEAREAVDCLLAESLHVQADAFAEQADRLVRDAETPPAAGEPRQNPHELRIAGKALRYTLEMAEVEGRSPGKGVMKTFKQMQEQLGTWHDDVVLADAALSAVVDAELTHHDVAAADRAIDLAREAVRRSAQQLSAFAKLWKRQGAGLTEKIRAALPLTKPGTPPGVSEAGAAEPVVEVEEVAGEDPVAAVEPDVETSTPDPLATEAADVVDSHPEEIGT